MSTTAGLALVTQYELQIITAFRAAKALSGSNAQRLLKMGLKDTRVLRGMVAASVIRKAGPDRYFLDEAVWASRRHMTSKQLLLAALGTLVLLGAGALYLGSR
jgi:hypothetical protein